jgi:AcrR family transcriptional regulator
VPAEALAVTRGDRIRDVALTLFAERGYRGTSMKDLAAVLGVTAPSLYNHLQSKHDLLAEVMLTTMRTLIADHRAAILGVDSAAEQLRRATEAHVRYHARNPREVAIGNREIPSLEEPTRSELLELRRVYAHAWEQLIARFDPPSPRLATYAILEMGIGVSMWFRPEGPMSEDEVAAHYGDIALRIAGA